MKRKIKMLFCTFVMSGMLILSMPTMASQNVTDVSTLSETVQPRTAIKEWRYKVINGNLYKRLYNYTTGHWEGDWIFVASGVEEV